VWQKNVDSQIAALRGCNMSGAPRISGNTRYNPRSWLGQDIAAAMTSAPMLKERERRSGIPG
jgi:hypothetical protein